jgi:DNA-binding NarL/FixJ family response regulator
MSTAKKIVEERYGPEITHGLSLHDFSPDASDAARPPKVYIYSEHPLAKAAIESTLASDCNLCSAMRSASQVTASLEDGEGPGVTIIDICSISNWPELVSRSLSAGSSPIALLPSNKADNAEQLRALYLGIRGIVTFSPNLEKELPLAVRSVAKGKLWISRETLDEYVRHTNLILSRLQSGGRPFTAREEQIVRLVIKDFSNKQIASVLQISERTVKFHISNIFQKSNVTNREELLQKAQLSMTQ